MSELRSEVVTVTQAELDFTVDVLHRLRRLLGEDPVRWSVLSGAWNVVIDEAHKLRFGKAAA